MGTNRSPPPLPWRTCRRGCAERLSWQPDFVDCVARSERPGAHPLHESGAYYCLDLSSVFCASPLTIVPPGPELNIDMCAAPGGKSISAWRALRPQLLVSNEVIGKRLPALISNLKRCHIAPSIVTCHDTKHFSTVLQAAANLVLVDAPCSGQSLAAKGKDAPSGFHPVTVKRNAQRQRRILATAADAVAGGGHLLYMTCTFSIEENEKIVEWFLAKNSNFESVACPHLEQYRSRITDHHCYRLFPHQHHGAGGFTTLLRRIDDSAGDFSPDSLRICWKNDA